MIQSISSQGKHRIRSLFSRTLLTALLAVHVAPASAQETTNTTATAEADYRRIVQRSEALPTTTVIGSEEMVPALTGSGQYLNTEDIRQQNFDDINRVLRKVPGVYVREEDGFGLFPNISLRGVDTSRSAKVTIMEDGVMMAPAPYSAPAAYFSPTAGRMHGIEVLKGSSQIKYGPHITGGVINYLSTPIPDTPTGYLKTTYGSFDDMRTHVNYGNTISSERFGTIGFLGELYYRTNEGFKDIDTAMDFNGNDTGLTNAEPMFKIFWEPNSERYQRFEFKYGYTDRDANETYLGLSDTDFNGDPYRRYASSRYDEINSWQNRMHLRHYIELTDQLDVTTTLYHTNFHRNWYKLNDVRNIDTDGDGTGDGVNQSLSEALAGAGGNVGLDVLRGDRAGDLRVRANNRDYYTYGISLDPTYHFSTENAEHELQFGMRYHVDRIRRFQHQDVYSQMTNGTISGVVRGAPGSQSNRRAETQAAAFYVRDQIDFGRLTVTPGIRIEHLWQEQEDFGSNTYGKTDYALFGGGVSAGYEINELWTVFGGVHRGFSPPSPGAAINGLREETSIASELGLRRESASGAFRAEITGFYTYFDDLIVISNVGGAGSGMDENVGRVDSYGIEFVIQYDLGLAYDLGYSMPNFLTFTWTDAELADDSNSTDPESIFAGGTKGNKVPYIPEYLLTLGTGVEVEDEFGIFVTGSFVDETYTTALNNTNQVNANGDPDARFGKLDAHFVVDLSGYLQLNDQARFLAGMHNVFDEQYTASRHPHGSRPGMPRYVYAGVEIDF